MSLGGNLSTSDKKMYNHKIVLLGDMGVGKTCITKVYVSGDFEHTHAATIGGMF